jgi:hypothetical protein
MRNLSVMCLSLVACLWGETVHAADLSALNWGEFRVAVDSGAKPAAVATDSSGTALTLSMKLDHLSANADGAKTEASSSMEGEFVVEQPHKIALHSMRIELEGHIVKTQGSTARLTVNIGGVQKSVDWTADDVKSGTYKEMMDVAIPSGELPVPFPVTASATVSRPKDKGAVLLTLESIKVTIGQAQVADFSWGTFTSAHAMTAANLAQ